jgi:hypothetical protein
MKFWALLALAASVAAIPFEGRAGPLHKRAGVRSHIGYRTVSKARPPIPSDPISSPVTQPTNTSQGEADAINKNGGKSVQSLGTQGRQLDSGIYISPVFQDFPDFNPDDGIPWDCAVTVDASVWAAFKKAWVPEMFEFPEDREKNPDKCSELPLWTPRYSACLFHRRKSPFFSSFFSLLTLI